MTEVIKISMTPDYVNHQWDISVTTDDGITLTFNWSSEIKPTLREAVTFLSTLL
jgi:hypothetical protein